MQRNSIRTEKVSVILFKESQQLKYHYLLAFIISVSLLYNLLIAKEGHQWFLVGDLFLLYILISTFGVYLLSQVRLETTIDKDFISICYAPFIKRKWHWSQLEHIEVINDKLVGCFGFGYHAKHGVCYGIKGNFGLAITTISGRKIVIGTQKKEELEKVLVNRYI